MKYVVVGASAAGVNAVKTLRMLDSDAEITLISRDNKIYSRCMLHHVISNHKSIEDISFIEEGFISKNNINWIKDKDLIEIDSNKKSITLETTIKNNNILNKISNKNTINYDKLLIATGASSFLPPIKNLREAKFVYGLRNEDDVIKIKDKAKDCKKVAILGSGLVGIDAVMGLLEYKDLEVSLVYIEDFILNRQLDKYTANIYEAKLKDNGVKLYPKVSIKEISIDDNKNVKGIILENGEVIECDMMISATGVVPNAKFINDSNLEYNRGIVINDKCETNIEHIYAAGDVVGKNAIWPLAVKQGITAAYNMVGKEKELDDSFTLKNSMNFFSIPAISLGICEPIDDTYVVKIRKDEDNYKKIIFKDNVIYGAVVQGDISYVGTLSHLIKNKIKVDNLEKRVFDIGYADFFDIKENGEFCYNI